jgi:hypothetical protein
MFSDDDWGLVVSYLTLMNDQTLQRKTRPAQDLLNGYKRLKSNMVHRAVATLGHLLGLQVTPANAQERAQVAQFAQAVQEATGVSVEVGSWLKVIPVKKRPRPCSNTGSDWRR